MKVTRIDPEELAYPAGSLRQSRRRGHVLFDDGIVRPVLLGIPDTFFTIPAAARISGKYAGGYVSVDSDDEEFHFHLNRKDKR